MVAPKCSSDVAVVAIGFIIDIAQRRTCEETERNKERVREKKGLLIHSINQNRTMKLTTHLIVMWNLYSIQML